MILGWMQQVALRENILSSSSRELSRIEWPRNSIPRRIKKLSWEDESVQYESGQSAHYSAFGRDRDISTLTGTQSFESLGESRHYAVFQANTSRSGPKKMK